MPSVLSEINGPSGKPRNAELNARIDDLQQELGRLSQSIVGLSAAKRDEALTVVRSKIDKLQSDADDYGRAARKQARDLQDHAGDLVRDKPLVTLGCAIGAGILIGMLSRRD